MLYFLRPIKANLEKSGGVPAQVDSYENNVRDPVGAACKAVFRARAGQSHRPKLSVEALSRTSECGMVFERANKVAGLPKVKAIPAFIGFLKYNNPNRNVGIFCLRSLAPKGGACYNTAYD